MIFCAAPSADPSANLSPASETATIVFRQRLHGAVILLAGPWAPLSKPPGDGWRITILINGVHHSNFVFTAGTPDENTEMHTLVTRAANKTRPMRV